MNTVAAILKTALPVFTALFLGMLCRSRGFLTRDGVDGLKWTVLNLCLPFVLFHAFSTAEYSPAALLIPGTVFVLCCIILGLGLLVVKVFTLGGRVSGFLASGFEAGMLGYALFALLFPDVSISRFALPDLGQTLFVFTVYKILISGKKDVRSIVRDMVTSPILWAVLLGVLTGATRLYTRLHAVGVGSILDSLTDFLSAPTGMIILLTVGYDLVLRQIPWKKTLGLVAMRLCTAGVFGGLLILLNRPLLRGMIFEGAVLLLAILPPPYVLPVFADEPNERVQICSALSALTVMTILLFAVMSVLIGLS